MAPSLFSRYPVAALSWVIVFVPLIATVFAAPTVSNVRAAQRAGTNFVDLYYDLASAESGGATVFVVLSGDAGATYDSPVTSLSGDVGSGVQNGLNRRIAWDAGTDRPGFTSAAMRFRVVATPPPPLLTGFAFIPAGAFIMGSPIDEIGRSGNEIQHHVIFMRSFYMQVTEVTWTQWNEVRDWALVHGYTDLASGQNGGVQGGFASSDESGDHPVTRVNWYDIVKWLNARSEMEGLSAVYRVGGAVYRIGESVPDFDAAASGYRLPTEAEWEYGCRAGTATAFHNGSISNAGATPVDPNLDVIGWYSGNSSNSTHRVGEKIPNAWGLYDMSGNVWELCWDWSGDNSGTAVTDPMGPATGTHRVDRGGSWRYDARVCRSSYRGFLGPNVRNNDVGFRPVRSLVN
jgi:formylglycine-generating enzyme required for sulfatase activity